MNAAEEKKPFRKSIDFCRYASVWTALWLTARKIGLITGDDYIKIFELIIYEKGDSETEAFTEYYATRRLAKQRLRVIEKEIGETIPVDEFDINAITINTKVVKP